MKNKKLLYLLVPLTLLLWGSIILKIFNSLSGNGEAKSLNQNESLIKNEEIVFTDTFSLVLNYSDPFLGNGISKVANSGNTTAPPAKNIKEKQIIVATTWPEINYKGLIRNQKSSKQLALVEINGQGNTMRAGESFNNVELTKVFKDSIEVKFGKERKYIKK